MKNQEWCEHIEHDPKWLGGYKRAQAKGAVVFVSDEFCPDCGKPRPKKKSNQE